MTNMNTTSASGASAETISELNASTIDGLKSLVTINRDAAKGFRKTVDAVGRDRIAFDLAEYADERDRFANEIARALKLNDEDVPDSSTLGAVHRWWLGVRAEMAGDETEAVLKEATRGEQAAVDTYRDTLPKITGNPLNELLHSHMERILDVKGKLESQAASK